MTHRKPYENCDPCTLYMIDRHVSLLPAMNVHSLKTGEALPDTLVRYMTGVHERHLSGLSLDVTA